MKKPTSVPGIYSITTPDDRIYVGQARNIGMRWSVHKHHLRHGTHNNPDLQAAWGTFGEEGFRFQIEDDLSSVTSDLIDETLNRQEARIFDLHQQTYNLVHPDILGVRVLEDTRAKLAKARKAAWARDPGGAKRVSERMKALKGTPEAKAAFSAFSREIWSNPKHQAAQSVKAKERWTDPDFRENLAAQLSSAWKDEENRAKRVTGMKAAWADPTVKAARIAATARGLARRKLRTDLPAKNIKKWAGPDAKEKHSAGLRAIWADPAKKEARRAALKAAWARRKANLGPPPQ